ncbi:iron-dependent peroxidase [Klebsiella quasipneumoniae]|nr:iron-dependent peroxidase [Klebsiella quasipneumoniae]
MSQVQSGICRNIAARRFGLKPMSKGTLTPCAKRAKFLSIKWPPFRLNSPDAKLGAVVAFGNNVWRQLSGGEGRRVKRFPVYGKGLAPSTPV